MLLKYIYDTKLAQASYLLGCPDAGVAMVIDPARDISPYLQSAAESGLKITHVGETHIHADYASGGRELAAKTGATLVVSGMGEGALAYDFSASRIDVHAVHDGDILYVGGIRVDIMHTPGHTPEHIVFLVTDTGASLPIGLFSGDCLFVGDVGRPDLLDATGNAVGTSETGARQQYANIQRLKTLPDYLQVWPGHGAGSACGKALGAIPSTTMGYEKLFNPAFQQPDADTFAQWLLDGQPEAPRYFGQMKRINRVGAALQNTLAMPEKLGKDSLPAALSSTDMLVIDTRRAREFARQHVPGTINIPGRSDHFSTYAGAYINYERPTYLIAAEDDIPRLVNELRAIGVDDLAGYFTLDIAAGYETCIAQITANEVVDKPANDTMILDVRGQSERSTRHIPGSLSMPMDKVTDHYAQLPHDKTIIVQCGSGVRSQIVASYLKKHGFDVLNLEGGIDAWERAGLPLELN